MTISAEEQYMIELMNRARLDPLAEAALQGIDLNEGLAPGTLDGSQRQVLAPNQYLEMASISHSDWMLETNTFSHTGENGSSPGDRMADAGYVFQGSWTWGENVSWRGTTGTLDLEAAIAQQHIDLFLSPGHRENLLNGNFRELGLAQVEGDFTYQGTTYNASMVTQKFAKSGTDVFVTGVAYSDLDSDAFYSVGEGTAGVSFASGGASETTAAAGGYSLALSPASDGIVSVDTGELSGSVQVDLSGGNVKLDIVDGARLMVSSDLTIISGFADVTLLGVANTNLTGNDAANTLSGNRADNVLSGHGGIDMLYGQDGNDTLYGGADTDALFGGDGSDDLFGGAGDDGLNGGLGDDLLSGGTGIDWLYGGANNDTLLGGDQTDALFGEDGDDLIQGEGGDDGLDGGYGADTIEGGAGVDWLYGGFGNDILYGATEFQDSDDTDALFGEDGDDALYGGGGGDNLDGGAGSDALFGGGGSDWLYGQDGDDFMKGGDGSDVLFGNDGADTLEGGDAGDSIDGGGGNDVLDGGAGVDILWGGEGQDEFRISDPGDGEDLIRDFVSGEDFVSLDAAGFGLGDPGSIVGLDLWETGSGLPTTFSGSGPTIYYETFYRSIWFDPDGGDSSNAEILASLETGTLVESDVFLA